MFVHIKLVKSYWTNDSCWLSWNGHIECFAVATMTWLTMDATLEIMKIMYSPDVDYE